MTETQTETLTWDDLRDECSRIHTTRTRPMGSWVGAELREDSRMIDVWVDERPAQVVPTRMHEPGFYWRYMDAPPEDALMRSDGQIAVLRNFADDGKVSRRG